MPSPRFATTRWSVVLAAGGPATPAAREALATLCRGYWYPLYAYARRRGQAPQDAEDLVQGFFARLLAKEGALAGASPERGRFRAYLLRAFKNHLLNEAQASAALKRGGGTTSASLSEPGERRLGADPGHERTPERLFERDWALSLLNLALERVRESYVGRGRGELFEGLADLLQPGSDPDSYAERAERLGMREGALKVAVHRLRARYRRALVEAVAHTLAADVAGEAREEAVQVELRQLLAAL